MPDLHDLNDLEDTPSAQCEWCSGSGWLGGPSYYNPGEGGEECRHCQGDGWVYLPPAQAQPQKDSNQ